eukprot:7888266-Pyramimonas_sp.AAC.1
MARVLLLRTWVDTNGLTSVGDLPVSASHTHAVQSSDVVAMSSPLWSNTRSVMGPAWPASTCTHRQCHTAGVLAPLSQTNAHMRAVPSVDAVTNSLGGQKSIMGSEAWTCHSAK